METPNLDYVNSLARDDDSFKDLLIDVIKNEFPVERKEYFESCKNNDYKKIEESVHKIKHKISILGLEESYKIADEYEHNLRLKSNDKASDFNLILATISNYLKTI